MRIHALPTGHVVLKLAFLHPRPGLRRRLDLLLPGRWSEPMPIRAWLIEHGDERILVDMGDTVDVKDAPFARHTVTPEDELPLALRAAGLTCEDVTSAVVTHLHPDHFHGAVYLTTSVRFQFGVYLIGGSFHNTIGGGAPGQGNVISTAGPRTTGIGDTGTSDQLNVIQGNAIGMSSRLQGDALHLDGDKDTVGGTAPGTGNTIAAFATLGGPGSVVQNNDFMGGIAEAVDGVTVGGPRGAHLARGPAGNTFSGSILRLDP